MVLSLHKNVVQLVVLDLWLPFCSIVCTTEQSLVKTPPKINLSFPSDHEDVRILPKLRLTFQLDCLDVLVVELFVVFDSRNVLVSIDDMKVF